LNLFLLDRYYDQPHAEQFGQRVVELCEQIKTDPDYLMMVMYFESRLKPYVQSDAGTGVGFIQMIHSTAHRLGTTPYRLKKMNGLEQFNYVEKYFEKYVGRVGNLVDLYLAAYYPNGVQKKSNYRFRLPAKYRQANKVFPIDEGNFIEKWRLEKGLTDFYIKMGYR